MNDLERMESLSGDIGDNIRHIQILADDLLSMDWELDSEHGIKLAQARLASIAALAEAAHPKWEEVDNFVSRMRIEADERDRAPDAGEAAGAGEGDGGPNGRG